MRAIRPATDLKHRLTLVEAVRRAGHLFAAAEQVPASAWRAKARDEYDD